VLLLRVFGAGFSMALRRELAYRTNLVFQLTLTVINVLAGLATLQIIYGQTATLGGWQLHEGIVLLGTYQIVTGLYTTFVEPNLQWFPGQVLSGKLDDMLLKPVPSIFLASLGSAAPLALTQVVVGAAVLVIGLREGGVVPSAWGVASWTMLLATGTMLIWASRVLIASIALWTPAVELDVVYGALLQWGRYPVSIYRQPLRFVLTYILPVAFISTLPARALTRGVEPWLLLLSVFIGLGAVFVVRAIWNAGLRRYTSATS
jgi:ABC-2 type transport system permease protein